MAEELDERAKDVLKAVVKEFITKGDPVGSSQLTRRGEFEVSPATMRNVLSELEELGYLEKPHTSAGRVPTDRGYRFFVDSLLQLREPGAREQQLIQQGLSANAGVEERLTEASKVLHQLTQHASVVITPRPSTLVVTRIELVRLREDRVLAILVGGSGQVQNKLLSVDFALSADELVGAANFLNELFAQGASLDDVRGRILVELDGERAQYDALVQKALMLGKQATELANERVLIEGQGSFLETKEFAEDVRRMRALFKALDDKHKLLSLLDRVQRGREMRIFIGAESEFSSQGDVTVIASPYGSKDAVLGAVGVIGPTRLDYQRVIPLVDFTAQVLSRALDDE
ncbi:MAG: heat-inducible transcription repressor HrcA [Archangiaceae bacterium]|nr:heat-inducible transcription repressor HrcA [Archangiaceae bacterium]